MSLFFGRQSRPVAERRELIPFGAHRLVGDGTYASVSVTTMESALRSVAVHSAVDLIASLGSELPIAVYSGEGPERVKQSVPGYLLDPAGDGHGLEDWSYQLLQMWMLRGNAVGSAMDWWGEIPTQVIWQHPDEVGGWVDPDGRIHWTFNGRPVEDPKTVFHRRAYPVPGRIMGLSVIAHHAEDIALPLTASRFGFQFLRDGAHPTGILVNKERSLTADQARTAKDRFMAGLRGTREPAVLDRGWEYQRVQIAPAESQFLETRQYGEVDCARLFGPGVPEIMGYKTGGSMDYSNRVDRSADFLVYTMNKWLKRVERVLSSMLPRSQYVEINRDAMLETTTLERYRAHELALKNRWRVINEVRKIEGLPPVAWGDEPSIEEKKSEAVKPDSA